MATPSHVDLSTLWVPIMPETSKLGPAMEDAGKSATESFDKGSAGIGEKLHDKVSHATDKLKDVFHRAGHDAGDAMSDGVKAGTDAIEKAADESAEKTSHKFRDAFTGIGRGVVGAIGPDVQRELSNRLEDVVGGAFKSTFGGDGVKGRLGDLAGQGIATVFNFGLDDLRQKLSDTKDAVGQTRSAFADLTGGNTLAGVQGLTTAFKTVGLTAADLPKPLQDAVGKMDDAKQTIGGVSDIFTALPGKVGQFGSALSGLAGPLAVVAASVPVFSSIRDSIRDIGDAHPDLHWLTQLAAPDQDSPWDSHAPLRKLWNWATGHKDGAPSGTPLPPNSLLGPSGVDDMLLGGGQGAGGGFDSLFGGGRGAGGGFDSLFGGGSGIGGSGGFSGDLSGVAPAGLPSSIPAAPGVAPSGSGLNLSTIPIAAQKYANDCIDASARIILSHSGINMTEDQLMGVIAPGGTIDSQAAGMNRLNPAGGFRAMAGSGGSAAAMFAAIKASIDSGTGSVLNVAPGSSLAGRNFSEGHFIAATGYNPDGTINVSDTAGGTTYSVSAADAFQATRGRGIVAGTGVGPAGGAGPASPPLGGGSGVGGGGGFGGGGSGSAGLGSVGAPTGAQHDPIYTAQADSAGGGAGAGQSQGQQLGQGLVDGLMQAVGLDGSVFKGFGGSSNPLHFGITKLATGLANVFGGMIQGGQGGGAAGGLGGGGGGIPGLSMLSGLGALPAGGIPQGPGGSQSVSSDFTTHNYYGPTGPQLNVTQNGVQSPTADLHGLVNGEAGRSFASTGNNAGNLPG